MHINDLEVGEYYMFVFQYVEQEDTLVRLNAIHGQNEVEIELVTRESDDIYVLLPANPRSLRELTSDEYINYIIKPAARNVGTKLYEICNNVWQGIVSALTNLWEGIVTFVEMVRCNVWDKHEIDWLEHWYYSDSDHEYYKPGYCKRCGKRVTQAEGDHNERLR